MAAFTTPTARKEHTCKNCGKALPRGEQYLRVAWPRRSPLSEHDFDEYGSYFKEEWTGAYCDQRCFDEKQAKSRW